MDWSRRPQVAHNFDICTVRAVVWKANEKKGRDTDPGGVLLGILGGVCRPVLQILALFQTGKNVIFHIRFQAWPLGRNYVIITDIRAQTKKFFESIYNSYISLSFLLIWNWNDKYVDTITWFPRKPNPIPDQNGQNLYPFLDQKGAKTQLVGAADTYMAYIREYLRDTEFARKKTT